MSHSRSSSPPAFVYRIVVCTFAWLNRLLAIGNGTPARAGSSHSYGAAGAVRCVAPSARLVIRSSQLFRCWGSSASGLAPTPLRPTVAGPAEFGPADQPLVAATSRGSRGDERPQAFGVKLRESLLERRQHCPDRERVLTATLADKVDQPSPLQIEVTDTESRDLLAPKPAKEREAEHDRVRSVEHIHNFANTPSDTGRGWRLCTAGVHTRYAGFRTHLAGRLEPTVEASDRRRVAMQGRRLRPTTARPSSTRALQPHFDLGRRHLLERTVTHTLINERETQPSIERDRVRRKRSQHGQVVEPVDNQRYRPHSFRSHARPLPPAAKGTKVLSPTCLGRSTHRTQATKHHNWLRYVLSTADNQGGQALVAQGIEHRFPKPCAAGSNPAGGASLTRVMDSNGLHRPAGTAKHSRASLSPKWATCSNPRWSRK